jgi:nitrite reductase (cytochrome c-552)
MIPEKALQWYDDHGYVDWTYESTGAKMLAIRHAEYEFNYGGEGSHMNQLGYDCNDCHMATKIAPDGTVYTDHHWINPTENDELIARDCSKCHADLKAEVKAIQARVEADTVALGKRCEQFIHNFENAIAAGTLTDEQIERLQWIQRASCYYWNLAAAENSEGAHNPRYYDHTLDMGNKVLDEGDAILGESSKVA